MREGWVRCGWKGLRVWDRGRVGGNAIVTIRNLHYKRIV